MRTAEEIIKENGWDEYKTVAEIKAIQADAWQDAIKHAISIAKRYSKDLPRSSILLMYLLQYSLLNY